jgi:hypothetical protein
VKLGGNFAEVFEQMDLYKYWRGVQCFINNLDIKLYGRCCICSKHESYVKPY